MAENRDSSEPASAPSTGRGKHWQLALDGIARRVVLKHSKLGMATKVFVDDTLVFEHGNMLTITKNADIPVQVGQHQLVIAIRDKAGGSDYYLTVDGVPMEGAGAAGREIGAAGQAVDSGAPGASSPAWFRRRRMTPGQWIGVLLFAFCSGGLALSLNGFGPHLAPGFILSFLLSIVGGAIGGAMYSGRPKIAGFVGGMIAGPCCFLATYFYTRHRVDVWRVELVLIACLASLPGIGVGWMLKKLFGVPDR